MSLKSRFKANTTLSNDGVWVPLGANTDKSECRIKLRRTGITNKLWSLAFRNRGEGLDLDNLPPEEDTLFMARVFHDAVVVDWENMQPEDDGSNWPHTEENVVKLLSDPDWHDFRMFIKGKADDLTTFQDAREADAKN